MERWMQDHAVNEYVCCPLAAAFTEHAKLFFSWGAVVYRSMCGYPLCGCVSDVEISGSKYGTVILERRGVWFARRLAPRVCREARSSLALAAAAVLCPNAVGGGLHNPSVKREISSARVYERGVRATKCDGRWRRGDGDALSKAILRLSERAARCTARDPSRGCWRVPGSIAVHRSLLQLHHFLSTNAR